MNNDGLNVLLNLMALATFTNPMAHKEHIQMNHLKDEAAVEKAYRLLAMHHSELLLDNIELRKQLARTSIKSILKMRWKLLWNAWSSYD
jgi:hypothetical protein